MANQEQVEILRRGPEVWNQWRRDNLYIEIDLREANLSRADLSGTELSGAVFNHATVKNTRFGHNQDISEPIKQDLKKRGAIFEDNPDSKEKA